MTHEVSHKSKYPKSKCLRAFKKANASSNEIQSFSTVFFRGESLSKEDIMQSVIEVCDSEGFKSAAV